MYRIGEGYDVHKLVPDRDLILGGVKVPFEKGLLGHSDADVLLHAIMDSLLGSLALGDIGKFFPDNNSNYKDANSLSLLSEVKCIIDKSSEKNNQKLSICNIDATIMCERPKLRNYIDVMRKNIAHTLSIDIDRVSIKATTEEGLGFTGEGLGIAARSVVLVEVKNIINNGYNV